MFSICSVTERAGKSDVRESAVSIRSGCYGWRHQCPVWANVSAEPSMVRSGSHHSPTAKDSTVEESGICGFSRRSQKTGQPRVVAVLWVDVGQFDRQSAESVGWPPPPTRAGRGLGPCRDQADLAGGAVLPCCFMDGANAGPAEAHICVVPLRWRGVGPHRPLPDESGICPVCCR